MGISRRFLNLIKDSSYRGTKGLLLFNSAIGPSRKLSTVGSGSESFLNLITDNKGLGVTSLRLVDLRGQLFNTSTPPPTFGEVPESVAVQDISFDADYVKKKLAQVAELNMDWFQLPAPIFSFQAAGVPYRWVDLFPFTDRKALIFHPSWGAFLFDVNTYQVATMPKLQRPKGKPISLFVPSADADDYLAGGGSLYIMEMIPKPERGGSTMSDQFKALVYGMPTMTSPCHSADCRLLPPPPFICDPAYHYPYSRITTYAAVGSDIYISAERAGTYCLDTLSNTWDKVGQWTLPFNGKVEYVPELKLWFGISAEHDRLAAADLTDMNSQPQLVDTDSWEDLALPAEWLVANETQLINLGSGRFCVARFFCIMLTGDDSIAEISEILVLTGVEVISPVHDGNCSGSCTREMKLAIRQHKSKCHISDRISILSVV